MTKVFNSGVNSFDALVDMGMDRKYKKGLARTKHVPGCISILCKYL